MTIERSQESQSSHEPDLLEQSGSAELVATLTVLAFVALAAASLFMTSPESVDAARSRPLTASAMTSEQPERPYQERYPVQPGGAQSDAAAF
jgi:hypothetical protein